MTHSLFLNLEKDNRMNYNDFIKDAVIKSQKEKWQY